MNRIYLDHNATSPLRESAREVLRSWGAEVLGNPSSSHAEGRRARSLLERAREDLAGEVDCHRDEVVFTSGGTESNALALTAAEVGATILAPDTDHPSLLESATRRGHRVPLPVDAGGRLVEPAGALRRHRPGFVSAALANHETGVIQDVAALATAARPLGCRIHTDASQAFGRMDVSFRGTGVDLMTVCSHKLGGPVGVGALIVRAGVTLRPSSGGGGQEAGMRAGTEPAVLAAAFAAAARESRERSADERARWREGVEFLRARIARAAPEAVFHTPRDGAIPNTLCVSFPGRPGPALVHRLDLQGVSVSHGSACASGSLEPSAVLLGMGLDEALATSSVRISLGSGTTLECLRRFVAELSLALAAVPARAQTFSRDNAPH